MQCSGRRRRKLHFPWADQLLGQGTGVYLAGNDLHALKGVEDASVLVTIVAAPDKQQVCVGGMQA